MTTPHKWASEIHAMVEGKEVEGFHTQTETWRLATGIFNPLTRPDLKWRIVPEKKVLRYRVALMKGEIEPRLLLITTDESADYVPRVASFIEWVHNDWQEVEVE